MKHSTCLIFVFLFLGLKALAQCNGYAATCNKRYDQVSFLTTHNAFNSAENNFFMPNQNYGVTRQLEDGVRALMLDVYDSSGTVLVYHGFPVLGRQLLVDILVEVKDFLDQHTNEVVTIIFESYVSSNAIENTFQQTGLSSRLFTKQEHNDWPTLQEMISADKRLVVFSDINDAGPGQDWYHYVWKYCVETHFSVHDTAQFTNDFNRGDSVNDLFIFNHFVTTSPFGLGSPTLSAQANLFSFLSSRILENYLAKNKFPNFITLDFYDIGDGKKVVDWVNSGVLSFDKSKSGKASVFPNPSAGSFFLFSNLSSKYFRVLDMLGKPVKSGITNPSGDMILTLELDPGYYLLCFETGDVLKICVEK